MRVAGKTKENNMLKDRITLVEQEIIKLADRAAHMYLDAMISDTTISPEYESIREHITDLQHECNMIKLLLAKGHE